MSKKTDKKMIQTNLINRLVNTYPDSIVTEDGNLCFEETVYNFAQDLVDNMPESQQKSALGQVFKSYDELFNHLITYFPDMRYMLERQINNEIEDIDEYES